MIPHVKVKPKQAAEGCLCRMHCPICKNEEEHEEDCYGDMQREEPRMCPQNMQQLQPQNAQHHQPQNNKNSQLSDIPDRYAEQIKLRRNGKKELKV